MDDNRKKALAQALGQIEKQFGKGSVMRMGDAQAARDIEAGQNAGMARIHSGFDGRVLHTVYGSSTSELLGQSVRSAVIGSTRVPRRAGR